MLDSSVSNSFQTVSAELDLIQLALNQKSFEENLDRIGEKNSTLAHQLLFQFLMYEI